MLRLMVKVAILGGLLYIGAILAYPYYQYVWMRLATEEAADLGVSRLQVIRRGSPGEELAMREVTASVATLLQARARQTGIDLPAQGVQVLVDLDGLRVRTFWEAESRLPGYTHRVYFRTEGRRRLVW
jgi:hypothetical protein